MATALESNALFANSAHLLSLIATERKKSYLIDHGCTLLGILPVAIAELGVDDGDLEVNENTSLYKLTSSDVVALKESLAQTSWRHTRNVRSRVLDETMSSPLKVLKRAAESGLEV